MFDIYTIFIEIKNIWVCIFRFNLYFRTVIYLDWIEFNVLDKNIKNKYNLQKICLVFVKKYAWKELG